MPMRSSSLANNPLAITRELDGRYDVVLQVRDNLDLIEQVAGIDFAAILAELESAQDFTGITVVQGETVAWDAVNKILTVPKGDKGDKGDTGLTGPQGAQGIQGPQGIKGDTGLKGDTGSQGPKGFDGAAGAQGLKGDTGDDLTITQITYNGNGTFNWLFSDGTTYVTPDLRGPTGDTGSQGTKGDQGISVHHLKGTSTTNPNGDFGTSPFKDTYTFYGDANETINLGWFVVSNGVADGMSAAVYDVNGNGVVDNSERLGGELPNHYVNVVDNQAELALKADATTVTTGLATKINNSEKGVANGVATLDVNGKVVLTQIPDSVLGQLEYMGTWNFTTMPTATQKGQYWIANTGGNGYVVGDWAVWNGSSFDKVDNTDAVASVAGRIGNVVLTSSDVGLASVDNTADSAKNVLSATKWTTPRNIALTGDVTGNINIDGSANVSIATTIAANSVALGTDTTGNYVAGNTAGTGITISGTAGEGWSPTIAITNVGTAGTYTKVTTNAQGQVTAGTTLSATDIPALDASKITSGIIDAARLPAYVDDVLEFANLAGFPATGETGKIYIALDTNKTYRWSGSVYIYITSGAVDSVAGKTGIVTLVKGDVGLGNVDNTSDASKPVSTAQQTALDLKANIASPTFTGVPAVPTASVGTNTTQVASTAYVVAEINKIEEW